MRKILLAGAAMLATTGMAMAGNSEPIKISAFVTAKCTVANPNDIGFTDDAPLNATVTGNFSFSCNFAGSNSTGTTPLKVTFKSNEGGLVNPADTTGPKDYEFTYGTNPLVTSASLASGDGAPYPETSSGPGETNTRTFLVRLKEELTVNGTYQDTINVTVAP